MGNVTKKFKREYLKDTLELPASKGSYPPDGDFPGMTVHSDEIIEHSRWSVHHEMVFSINSGPDANKPGEAWSVQYSRGATESQDERPWEYEPEVSATLVRQVEKVVLVWVDADEPPSGTVVTSG
jgi:hypothetical protein